jgi:hypothetical protein
MSHLQAGILTVSVLVIAAVQTLEAVLGRFRR